MRHLLGILGAEEIPTASFRLSRNDAIEPHFWFFLVVEDGSIFYCIAVGKGRKDFLPKPFPPVSFAGRHGQFDGRFSLGMADDSGGDKEPEAQTVNGHLGLPAQMALKEDRQVIGQDGQS